MAKTKAVGDEQSTLASSERTGNPGIRNCLGLSYEVRMNLCERLNQLLADTAHWPRSMDVRSGRVQSVRG
jgi:hypothetical protein